MEQEGLARTGSSFRLGALASLRKGQYNMRDTEGMPTLQENMVKGDEDVLSKKRETRREVERKFPEMPHEIELKGELEDEEEILRLYREVEMKKQEAVRKRQDMTIKKLNKLDEEKQEMQKKIQYVGWTLTRENWTKRPILIGLV